MKRTWERCAKCEHVFVYSVIYLWMRNKESWHICLFRALISYIYQQSQKNVSQPKSHRRVVTNQPLKCVRQWTADIRVWRHTLPCHSMLFISTVSVFELFICPFPLSASCPMACRSSGRWQVSSERVMLLPPPKWDGNMERLFPPGLNGQTNPFSVLVLNPTQAHPQYPPHKNNSWTHRR